MPPSLREITTASIAAGVLSGAPSTTWTLLTGGDVLASTRAAGTLVPGDREPTLLDGIVVHSVLSVVWTVVLAVLLPRRGRARTAALGAVAGLGIAVLDLGVIAPRRYPAVAALPQAPQYADHAAFGAIVGWCLGR